MNHRYLILAVTVLAVAGCDSFVGVSEHQARLELADSRGWFRALAEENDEVIREIGMVKSGRLKQGEETTLPLEVTGAQRALVIGACDQYCSDLDLRVFTEDGRLIGVDEEEDEYPQVGIPSGKTHRLVVKVRMPKCVSTGCSFAVSQMEYEDRRGSTGSCFAVAPDGLVMTSWHVVENASYITVIMPDGRKSSATILRRSEDNDLALLRTILKTPEWLALADRSEILPGTAAFTLGFPTPDTLGSEVKFTDGVISSVSGYRDESTILQISTPIQPGSSGGPVVSSGGRVLGIVEAAVKEDADGGPMQLTNFARSAHVASLLFPPQTALPPAPVFRSREQAVAHAMKAVCQIETE